jgi:SAM-dependent methyltransferase
MIMQPTKQYFARLDEHNDIVQRDVRLIQRMAGDCLALLDIGCGVGAFLSQYQAARAVGVDVSHDAALFCRSSNLCVVVANGGDLPFTSASFDVVRSKEVLEHISNPVKMVSEMKRVLRERGLLICHVPTQFSMLYPFGANFFDDYTHIRPFSRQGIERLLQDGGFRILKTQGYTSPRDWWQRPIAPILSRLLPFLWRVVATSSTLQDLEGYM